MSEDALTYRVPGMSCDHRVHAVEDGLQAVAGVEQATAELETKLVTGSRLDDAALRAAIEEAGYAAE